MMSAYLISNVRILDDTGREPFSGFVRVEANRIAAATRLGGALMRRPDELGVVKAGALANLLLVDGDPLADIAFFKPAAPSAWS